MEAIPPTVVAAWSEQGADIETVMPKVITDPDPKLMPNTITAWHNHMAIQRAIQATAINRDEWVFLNHGIRYGIQ